MTHPAEFRIEGVYSADEAFKLLDRLGAEGIKNLRSFYMTVNGSAPAHILILSAAPVAAANHPTFKPIIGHDFTTTRFVTDKQLLEQAIHDHYKMNKGQYRFPEKLDTQLRISAAVGAPAQTSLNLMMPTQGNALFTRPAEACYRLLKALKNGTWPRRGCVTISYSRFIKDARCKITIGSNIDENFLGEVANLLESLNTRGLHVSVKTDVSMALNKREVLKRPHRQVFHGPIAQWKSASTSLTAQPMRQERQG